jgi:aldehyde dehydrogenase (NAD+)
VVNLLVFAYCSVDLAVTTAHRALFTHAGQVCFAASRIFVHSKVHDAFVAKSVELARKRVVGDPFNAKTEQGPQV